MSHISPSRPTQEATKRNASLLEDYNSGNFSLVDLVVKYRISSQRIYQIVNRSKSINHD